MYVCMYVSYTQRVNRSTNKKVIGVNVDPPKWTFIRKLYFGRYGVISPKIFAHGTTPKLYFQSDLGHRAASSWALPHSSSFIFFLMCRSKTASSLPLLTRMFIPNLTTAFVFTACNLVKSQINRPSILSKLINSVTSLLS